MILINAQIWLTQFTDKPSYRIYWNKRRSAYLIFRATSAVLIRGRRLFKHCTRQIYFFYIFIRRYTFYLLIFLWTFTKLIVNLELREKFTRWKNPESFMITRAKISAVRASWRRRVLTFLSQMRRLFEWIRYCKFPSVSGRLLLYLRRSIAPHVRKFSGNKDPWVKVWSLANKRGKIIYYASFLDISREGTAPRKSIQSKETGTSKFVERGRWMIIRN